MNLLTELCRDSRILREQHEVLFNYFISYAADPYNTDDLMPSSVWRGWSRIINMHMRRVYWDTHFDIRYAQFVRRINAGELAIFTS